MWVLLRNGLSETEVPAAAMSTARACVCVCVWACRFLLEALEDLDRSLRKLSSRLLVVRGQPTDVFPRLLKVRLLAAAWRRGHAHFLPLPHAFLCSCRSGR